ncbi:MAG: hypothetical protein ACYTG2_14600 [Planctomycetota bacterium]|jgi:hypothetical protein
MKFFIPSMGPGNAEAFYTGICSFVREQWGHEPTERRVHRVAYTHKGERVEVQVGKQLGSDHETIFAILEVPDAYLVCTPRHGVAANPPFVIKREHVLEVFDFEAPQEASATSA